MSGTLDGQDLFEEYQLNIEQGSICRDSTERTVAGLDGVLSIDLGQTDFARHFLTESPMRA